ncbi:hypothetical protein Bbelb_253040 [Branchiostoma belcheri]|nr:hypothetical protein Bbelb_253040 [Branchiostoma belcheri]
MASSEKDVGTKSPTFSFSQKRSNLRERSKVHQRIRVSLQNLDASDTLDKLHERVDSTTSDFVERKYSGLASNLREHETRSRLVIEDHTLRATEKEKVRDALRHCGQPEWALKEGDNNITKRKKRNKDRTSQTKSDTLRVSQYSPTSKESLRDLAFHPENEFHVASVKDILSDWRKSWRSRGEPSLKHLSQCELFYPYSTLCLMHKTVRKVVQSAFPKGTRSVTRWDSYPGPLGSGLKTLPIRQTTHSHERIRLWRARPTISPVASDDVTRTWHLRTGRSPNFGKLIAPWRKLLRLADACGREVSVERTAAGP